MQQLLRRRPQALWGTGPQGCCSREAVGCQAAAAYLLAHGGPSAHRRLPFGRGCRAVCRAPGCLPGF
eukprot:15469289-Alexandrium_andersonii.AAC.1